MARYLEQHQVPDGMIANVPWGFPLERWSDRMVERGLRYLAGDLEKVGDGEGAEMFPRLFESMAQEARSRNIEI